MSESTIAIIIVCIAIILFITEKIPLAVTAILAMLAMLFTGVLTYAEAFSGFNSTVVMLIVGMMIIGEAFFSSGLADKIGGIMYRFIGSKEKKFVLIVFIASMVLTAFFNSMIIAAIFMPIIDCIVIKSKGHISRKQTYLPLAIAGVIGSNLTIIGSTSILSASGLLENSYYGRGMYFFEPALAALPSCIAVLIVYMTFGYKLQQKCFDFEENPPTVAAAPTDMTGFKPYKMVLVSVTTCVCVLLFVLTKLNMGAVALGGAVFLILTRCVDEKRAFASVSVSTVFLIAASMGFAKGIEVSGAGMIISDFIIGILGPIGQSPYGMCVTMLLISTLLSNFMSNNAAVLITVPISLTIATALGADAMPFVLACAIGSNISLATPICVSTVTLTTVAGYRFKDYLRVGGLMNLISFVVTAIALKLLYFM